MLLRSTVVKNPPPNAGDTKGAGSIPGQEDPLEKETTIHSSILAWKIPWTEEPGGAIIHGVVTEHTQHMYVESRKRHNLYFQSRNRDRKTYGYQGVTGWWWDGLGLTYIHHYI